MNKIYGQKPVDLGLVDIRPVEMMSWLYCPIKLPGDMMSCWSIPVNLRQFYPIVQKIMADNMGGWLDGSYVYLTAKTLWVTPDNPGNRPGWHSDGFMTDDLNYVWSDTNGTLFWEPDELVSFTQDDRLSLAEMAAVAEAGPLVIYPDRHLLKLDQSVIHRVADVTTAGMRSFVKVSVSRNIYNLEGNSINHSLPLPGPYQKRSAERNQPSTMESS